MSDFAIEFESWEDYDQYFKEASTEELHSLLLEHVKCFPDGVCDIELEFIEEAGDRREAVVIKVLGAKNVGAQTVNLALDEGADDREDAITLSYAVMASPAINKELLLKTPAWDQEQAWWIMNHDLADIDVVKNLESTYGYSVRDTVSRIMYLEQTNQLDIYLTGSEPKNSGTPEREAELLSKIYAKTNGPEGLE
jgi:hypothetical protein